MKVKQVGHLFAFFHILLFPFIDPDADKLRVHELSSDRAQDAICTILHQSQLSGIEYHANLVSRLMKSINRGEGLKREGLAHILILQVELFISARALP